MTSPGAPIVSVIIAFLDPRIEFLHEAVASVTAQTFTNWELLLVDDGSRGVATAVARQYASAEPERVVYLDFKGHVNRGLAAARNLGLQHARGEYVATLDSDDVWVPEKLERQIRIFEQWPEAAMVYGTTRYWFGWTGLARDARRDFIQQHALFLRHRGRPRIGNRLMKPPTLLTLYLRDEAAVPSASNIMVRRSTIIDVGGFETKFQLYEDQTLYAKVCISAPVFVADECWDSYRQHPDSMCATARRADREVSRREYLEWLTDYLERSGVRDASLWRELSRKRWMAKHGQLGRVADGVAKRLRRMVGTPYPIG